MPEKKSRLELLKEDLQQTRKETQMFSDRLRGLREKELVLRGAIAEREYDANQEAAKQKAKLEKVSKKYPNAKVVK